MRAPFAFRRSEACRPQRSRMGAALVEFALVLPIFGVVVLGIVEFGRAMMVSQLLSNGARHGCRSAIIDGSTQAGVESDIRNFLSDALNVSASEVEITTTFEPGPGNPMPSTLDVAQSQDLIKVRVQIDYNDVDYFAGRFLAGKKLTGTCVMRHE